MKCRYCKDSGKCRKPLDNEKFMDLVEREMDRSGFISQEMAEEKVFSKVEYTLIDCPHCNKETK